MAPSLRHWLKEGRQDLFLSRERPSETIDGRLSEGKGKNGSSLEIFGIMGNENKGKSGGGMFVGRMDRRGRGREALFALSLTHSRAYLRTPSVYLRTLALSFIYLLVHTPSFMHSPTPKPEWIIQFWLLTLPSTHLLFSCTKSVYLQISFSFLIIYLILLFYLIHPPLSLSHNNHLILGYSLIYSLPISFIIS